MKRFSLKKVLILLSAVICMSVLFCATTFAADNTVEAAPVGQTSGITDAISAGASSDAAAPVVGGVVGNVAGATSGAALGAPAGAAIGGTAGAVNGALASNVVGGPIGSVIGSAVGAVANTPVGTLAGAVTGALPGAVKGSVIGAATTGLLNQGDKVGAVVGALTAAAPKAAIDTAEVVNSMLYPALTADILLPKFHFTPIASAIGANVVGATEALAGFPVGAVSGRIAGKIIGEALGVLNPFNVFGPIADRAVNAIIGREIGKVIGTIAGAPTGALVGALDGALKGSFLGATAEYAIRQWEAWKLINLPVSVLEGLKAAIPANFIVTAVDFVRFLPKANLAALPWFIISEHLYQIANAVPAGLLNSLVGVKAGRDFLLDPIGLALGFFNGINNILPGYHWIVNRNLLALPKVSYLTLADLFMLPQLLTLTGVNAVIGSVIGNAVGKLVFDILYIPVLGLIASIAGAVLTQVVTFNVLAAIPGHLVADAVLPMLNAAVVFVVDIIGVILVHLSLGIIPHAIAGQIGSFLVAPIFTLLALGANILLVIAARNFVILGMVVLNALKDSVLVSVINHAVVYGVIGLVNGAVWGALKGILPSMVNALPAFNKKLVKNFVRASLAGIVLSLPKYIKAAFNGYFKKASLFAWLMAFNDGLLLTDLTARILRTALIATKNLFELPFAPLFGLVNGAILGEIADMIPGAVLGGLNGAAVNALINGVLGAIVFGGMGALAGLLLGFVPGAALAAAALIPLNIAVGASLGLVGGLVSGALLGAPSGTVLGAVAGLVLNGSSNNTSVTLPSVTEPAVVTVPTNTQTSTKDASSNENASSNNVSARVANTDA